MYILIYRHFSAHVLCKNMLSWCLNYTGRHCAFALLCKNLGKGTRSHMHMFFLAFIETGKQRCDLYQLAMRFC